MGDEDAYERFDVDNDFEGGKWIGGEFFYSSKRKKRQQTEEDRIYGVFASGSDSDGGPRRRGKKEKADFSKPVSFVSTGQVIQPESTDAPKISKPQVPKEGSSAGLGYAGLGASSKAAEATSDGEDIDSEGEDGVLPTAFGRRILRKAEQRLKAEQQEVQLERRRRETAAADPTFAAFEKHTKGIGMKLLEKMGFKAGAGLGRDRQGISRPIEAKLRPKGQGLGLGSTAPAPMPSAVTGAGAQKPGSAAAGGDGAAAPAWKRRAGAVARLKREYRTADDVLRDASDRAEAGAAPVLASAPILDLRGPQARLVTSLEHLNVEEEAATGAKVPMPELQHNMKLLVDLSEAEIQRLDARLRQEQDTAALLAKEKARLEAEVAASGAAAARLANLANDVLRLQSRGAALELRELERGYAGLRSRYPEDYIMYGVASAALSAALPKFQAMLRGWQPMEDPTPRGLAELARWRPLLESSSSASAVFGESIESASDPYTLLVLETVVPPLRAAVATGWEPRDPEPLLAVLESWQGTLPASALSHVLEAVVLPRLRSAVYEWEPRAETVPIHAWLHPWLPLLGPALEELYPTIQSRLAAALTAWHPSDGSALVLLAPWRRVFGALQWESLLAGSIAPALQAALEKLVINPLQQSLEPLGWAMAWAEAMPLSLLARVLDTALFPRWLAVLHHWLSGSPNYEEVMRWYLGWKALFPQDLLDHERVRASFNSALAMMNAAVDGLPLPPIAPAPAPAPAPAASAAAAAGAGVGPGSHWSSSLGPGAVLGMTAPGEPSMKELVQRYAEEQGIAFVPKPTRTAEGLPVYAFGGVAVVLDSAKRVIRAATAGGHWAPVTLEWLVTENRNRGL